MTKSLVADTRISGLFPAPPESLFKDTTPFSVPDVPPCTLIAPSETTPTTFTLFPSMEIASIALNIPLILHPPDTCCINGFFWI